MKFQLKILTFHAKVEQIIKVHNQKKLEQADIEQAQKQGRQLKG